MIKSRLEILKTRRAFLAETLAQWDMQVNADEDLGHSEYGEIAKFFERWIRELNNNIDMTGNDSLRRATKDLSTKNRRWFIQ